MAATIQEALAASFKDIMDELKIAGVNHTTIAAEMGWDNTVVSQIKRGTYRPSIQQLDRLLRVINRHAPKRKYEPKDLFRDPVEILREKLRQAEASLKEN